jgi:hypothetical protein
MSRRLELERKTDDILSNNPKSVNEIVLYIEELEKKKCSVYDREVIYRNLSSFSSKYTKEGNLWSLKESVSYLKLIL